MKSGVIQSWGLVEFSTSSEAEMTQQLLNGHLINGKPIRVQVCPFFIPTLAVEMHLVRFEPVSIHAAQIALVR